MYMATNWFYLILKYAFQFPTFSVSKKTSKRNIFFSIEIDVHAVYKREAPDKLFTDFHKVFFFKKR